MAAQNVESYCLIVDLFIYRGKYSYSLKLPSTWEYLTVTNFVEGNPLYFSQNFYHFFAYVLSPSPFTSWLLIHFTPSSQAFSLSSAWRIKIGIPLCLASAQTSFFWLFVQKVMVTGAWHVHNLWGLKSFT